MQMIKYTLILILLTLASSIASAQMVEEKGIGELIYKGMFNIKTSDKQEALKKAKLNALQRYTSKFDSGKRQIYSKVSTKVEGDLDKFVPEARVLDEEKDKKAKTYTVVVRASINAGLIDEEMQKVSAINNVAQADKSKMVLVFIAREAKEVTAYGTEVQTQSIEEKDEFAEEETVVGGSNVAFSANSEKSVSTKSRSKNIKRADKIDYDVFSSEGIESTMTQIFSTAGFRSIGTAMVKRKSRDLFDKQKLINDYSVGDDISDDALIDCIEGLAKVRIKYFACGTLTVGEQRKNPANGLDEVSVNVNGKVYFIDADGFEEVVASVGPENYSETGTTPEDTKTNALKEAGNVAANSLVNQLSAKGLY